jgi:hypothetical protein
MSSKGDSNITTDVKSPIEVDEASDRSSIDARNPFKDPKVAEYYRDLYEKAQYESREAFDPEIEWTAAEEKSIVRRLDWHVCLWACIMFFALQLDRGNISQALSDNMLDDLGLTTNEYNYGMLLNSQKIYPVDVNNLQVRRCSDCHSWPLRSLHS